MDLDIVMGRLYDSEINCGLSSFWDGGWTVWLGDDNNGRRAEETFDRDSFADIADWLHENAIRCWPTSDYARAYVFQPLTQAALSGEEG